MCELPLTSSDDKSDNQIWTKGRVRLAALAIFLIVLLITAVLLSLGPTICCGVFSNITNSL